MRFGHHSNDLLNAEWKQHGETAFVFEVLDRVKYRDEPGFDVSVELDALVHLWREEIPCEGDRDYLQKSE